jgi:hypothetical protein
VFTKANQGRAFQMIGRWLKNIELKTNVEDAIEKRGDLIRPKDFVLKNGRSQLPKFSPQIGKSEKSENVTKFRLAIQSELEEKIDF